MSRKLFFAVAISLSSSFVFSDSDGLVQRGSIDQFANVLKCEENRTLVFISDKKFIPIEGTFFVDGLFGGDGQNFQSKIMNRSQAEIAKHREAAIQYFSKKFGVDVKSSSVFFNGFEVMPDIGYHVRFDSDRKGERYDRIEDGGWIVVVVDPDGLVLGGDFQDLRVPQGTMFVYGDYKINYPRRRAEVIAYKSNKPFIPQFDGSFIASFDLKGENYFTGTASATISPKSSSDMTVVADIRNVAKLTRSCGNF
jgi:hypothetical protein